MSSHPSNPAITPPGVVRHVTHEELVEQVRALHDREAVDYAAHRDLKDAVATDRLVMGHQIGLLMGLVNELREIVGIVAIQRHRATPPSFWARWRFW